MDWHPESLLSKEVSVSRPRVHIIDFEFAVEFPADCPIADRVCTGVPCTRWYKSETYSRPCPPELRKMVPYCPFKLDVWQLGWSFTCHGLKVYIFSITAVPYVYLTYFIAFSDGHLRYRRVTPDYEIKKSCGTPNCEGGLHETEAVSI